jgi:hypothetical protein
MACLDAHLYEIEYSLQNLLIATAHQGLRGSAIFTAVTTGPVERSNLSIFGAGVDLWTFLAGKSQLGPPLDARGLEQERRIFVQFAFTQP